VFSTEIVDHGGRRGDAMQALARWWHPVASSEALDVLHRAIRPALYCLIFFVIADFIVGHNLKLKTML
jgi:hypothetical protein